MTQFLHAALSVRSRENAERFYGGLLGLPRVREFDVSAALMQALFGIDSPSTALVYDAGGAHLELFLLPGRPPPAPPDHLCLRVGSIEALARACREAGLPVTVAPKGDGTVTFVSDFDGNRFELKE